MSCRDTIHLICWYLEGRLSASVEGEIKRHLESCADCHMVLDARGRFSSCLIRPSRK